MVDTKYGAHGVSSSNFYTHFSLLKSIEAGMGLPCLNHACDSIAALMSDLFGASFPAQQGSSLRHIERVQ
jgi:hypothetical protein